MALIKDTLREIRFSFGRFMSIFVIIALGCGFFTGLKATCPDMILTASDYFEDSALCDLHLRSNIGVKSADIAAVRGADGVSGACAGYSKDLYYSYDNQNVVLKAISINAYVDEGGENDLNRPVLTEGRMPEKKNECVVEKKMSSPDTFEIGNTITLISPSKDEDISDTLAYDTFEIVGIVVSPLYIGYERDSSAVGSGTVNSNIFLPEDAFVCDYYTDLFVSLDGLEGLDPFSDEYKQAVEEKGKAAEQAFEESVSARYEKYKSDAESKLTSAQSSIDSLEDVLSCDTENLGLLYDKAQATAESLQKQYDSMSDGARRYIVYGNLVQTRQKAEMLSALIADSDGSVRAGYETQLSDSKAELDDAKRELDETAELKCYTQTRFSSRDYCSYKDDAEKINNVSNAFPLFFIIVAALVCLNTMTRMVEEQRTAIGTYKALGYSSGSILSKYLIYGALAAVAGGGIGSAIGLQLFPKLIITIYRIMYNIPTVNTPFRPSYLVAAVAASVLLTSLAVIFTCMRELKGQPALIMRPKPPANGRRVLLERFPKIWNKLSFLMKVTVRNLLRYKKRFFMTVVGVAGCTALIITGFGLKSSVSLIVDRQFGDIFRYSAIATVNTDSENPFGAIDDCEDVKSYIPATLNSLEAGSGEKLYSANLIVTEKEPDGYITLEDTNGNTLSYGDGVIVSQKLADMCSLAVGDSVTLKESGGDEYSAPITGITKNYALNYIYTSREEYAEIFGDEPEYNVAMLIASDSADENEVKSQLISDDRILGVTFKSDSTKGFVRSIESMNAIVLMLIVCAAFLAVTVLYNLANINITERRREIATIKVLGFYNGETSAYIYRENIISTLVGIAVGLILGKLLHYFVVVTVEVEAVMFVRELAWYAYLFGALLTAVFAALVNAVLYFKFKKIDMAESLKSIE